MIDIVMGGMWGSEGKGSVVSVFAANRQYNLVIRTGSPQAGHTFQLSNGDLVKMRQLPATWYYAKNTPVYVPPGAVVNRDVLLNEFRLMQENGFVSRVYVSPQAAVIQPDAIERERNITTGTTGEGVGATRADKCMRRATLVRDDPNLSEFCQGIEWVDTVLNDRNSHILIEATQGFGLSLDSLYYPYCTSTNLTVHRVLDEAGVPFGVHTVHPVLIIRTFPIRIAGNSGPLNRETSWEALRDIYGEHIPIEQTTVTKKTRRVGVWDPDIVKEAIRMISPRRIVLTFVDYLFPNIRVTGVDTSVDKTISDMENSVGRRFDWLGIGIGELMSRDGHRVMSTSGRRALDNRYTVIKEDGA